MARVITLGVDLAAQPAGTAACVVAWSDGVARVRSVECGVDDARLLALVATADRVGLDVPFGWPDEFARFLAAHGDSARLPEVDVSRLRYRETDRLVHERTGRWPLSVSSDLIAVPAFRAARLFAELAVRGAPVDRSGGGKLVEVYPAAALRQWGFDPTGYKGDRGREVRATLLASVETRIARYLRWDAAPRATCRASDDALDALVAALVARAVALGLCAPIPEASRDRAAREGWIALPDPASLDRLAG